MIADPILAAVIGEALRHRLVVRALRRRVGGLADRVQGLERGATSIDPVGAHEVVL